MFCPSGDKNSVTPQVYRPKPSDPNSSARSSIAQFPLKASWTWNKLASRLLSSPGTVALAISRLFGAMPKKRPLGDCRMILPQFQCTRKTVSGSSGCPSAITVLWRLWRRYWEKQREARNENLTFLPIIFIPRPSFPHITGSLFHSPRVCSCFQILFGKHGVAPVLPLPQSVLYPRAQYQKGTWIPHMQRNKTQPRRQHFKMNHRHKSES